MIEYESKMLPLISKALASEGETKAVVRPPKKKPLDLEKLEAIITTELS